MLLELADLLKGWYSGFHLFQYLTFRAIMSTLTALAVSLLIGPAVIRKLADRLGLLDRYKDVVDHSSAFFAKCGAFPRLEWSVVYALQQLGRYAEAVKHETVIIEDDPFDSDYWWWRGEDRARSNQPDLALADYRQSFANSESERDRTETP